MCLSVSQCMFVPSYLHQFRMYGAGLSYAYPGAHGDGSYIKEILEIPPGVEKNLCGHLT